MFSLNYCLLKLESVHIGALNFFFFLQSHLFALQTGPTFTFPEIISALNLKSTILLKGENVASSSSSVIELYPYQTVEFDFILK